jgi:hypothetical protein
MPAPAAVLPIFPQGTEPIVWSPGYRTDVIAGPGRPEQRIRLRERPVRTIEYPILTTAAEESQIARSLPYQYQGQMIGIPLWLWASRLTIAASIGATAFTLGTIADLVPWETGSWVMLWRGNDGPAPVWELLEFASEASGVVHTVGAATRAWAAGTILVPVQLGRLTGRAELRHRTHSALGATIAAELASSAGGTLSRPSPPTYGGVEVLPRLPRAPDLGSDVLERELEGLDPITGEKSVQLPSPVPVEGRSLSWICESRAELVELLAFLQDRAGRLKPFWIPSWRQDLTLAVAASSGSSTLRIKSTGYASHVYPAGGYRRNLALRAPGGALQYRKATSAIDQGDGTETVTLDSPLSAALPLGSLLMFLELVRLDTDEPRVEFHHAGLMRATLPLLELPLEVPAGAVLMEIWYLDSSPSRTFNVTGGTGSTVDATAAQLRDGDDTTADTVTANGDGVSQGQVNKDVTFTLGAVEALRPVNSIELVRILMRGQVQGDPGSTAVIHARYDGETMPGAVSPDDYLLPPPDAFVPTWHFHDYAVDPRTGLAWDRTNLLSHEWGFRQLLETFSEFDSNTMAVCEMRVQLWGPE